MSKATSTNAQPGFIPPDLEIKGWSDLQPYYEALLAVKIQSATDLEDFLVHYSEFLSVFSEGNAWAYINMTCHTNDKAYQKRHEMFVEKINPELEKASNALDKMIAASPFFGELPPERYTQFKQKLQRDLELFRPKNVPLATEIGKLSSQYDHLMGGLVATIDGEDLPLPRATAKLQSADREVRQKAWLAIGEARYAVKTKADELYDAMRKIRHEMALNAGYRNFRDFQHARLQRFDYTPRLKPETACPSSVTWKGPNKESLKWAIAFLH